MTLLLCLLLAETVYYICFGQKSSCLRIVIAVLIWLVLPLLNINPLMCGLWYPYPDGLYKLCYGEAFNPVSNLRKGPNWP